MLSRKVSTRSLHFPPNLGVLVVTLSAEMQLPKIASLQLQILQTQGVQCSKALIEVLVYVVFICGR